MRFSPFLLVLFIFLAFQSCEVEPRADESLPICLIQTSEIVGGENDFQFKWAFNCTVEFINVIVLNGFGQEVESFGNINDLRAFDVHDLEPENEQSITYYWLAEFETLENPGVLQTQRGRFIYLAN